MNKGACEFARPLAAFLRGEGTEEEKKEEKGCGNEKISGKKPVKFAEHGRHKNLAQHLLNCLA